MHSLLAVFSRPFQSLRRLAAATAATLVASTICTPLGAQASWVQWTAANGGNDHWYLAVRVPGGIAWSGGFVGL
ncbi:MAG: hypothetical protein IPK26_03845 [Planctomycetes bacterium]|nr:hypothetical protein [Planctomycetota bacterium]